MSAEAEKPVLNTNIRAQHRGCKRLGRDQVVEGLLWVSFAGTLILIFAHALLSHAQRAADPLIFNDDARAWIYSTGERKGDESNFIIDGHSQRVRHDPTFLTDCKASGRSSLLCDCPESFHSSDKILGGFPGR